jgi:RNA polymerase sigma-70 factor (ECF subfamily)
MPATRREFESLLMPLMDSLYRTALRMTGQDATAQDLVQETTMRAYRSFAHFVRGSNFRAWIFRIMTNTYINEYRRRGHAPQSLDMAEIDPSDPSEVEYVRQSDVEALTETLGDEARRAIDKLPPDFRLVFLLSTFEGCSYREIAEIAGVPIGTVMSRLFRARAMVRAELLAHARDVAP